MRGPWIAVYVGSVCFSLFVVALLPREWRIHPVEALLLGSALYFGAFHRHVLRTDPGPAHALPQRLRVLVPGLLPRGALFLTLAAVQAFLCYQWIPHADVRGGFVVATTWLVAISTIDASSHAVR